ncbi:IS66 family insertion sequence element accessory protein TnpA [Heliorestis convoluta]|uniref:Transposase n=1 Tax=Heliorestis convoluta TaxID=356322 RepID=A0A5Q2MXI1_9FIRM|nr:hypothetical protein FTV88_1171 [Heliorestis convoluta]
MMTKEELRLEWAERLAAFKESGLSVPKWCAANDVKTHQLRYWLRKTEERKQAPAMLHGCL